MTTIFFQISKLIEDQKIGLRQNWKSFFLRIQVMQIEFKRFRCRPESNYWGNVNVDHSQINWGCSQIIGGIYPPPPRVSATLSLYYAESCNKLARPISAPLLPGNAASFKEMFQRWRAVGNTVSNLTGPRFEPHTSRFRDERVTTRTTGW